MLWIYVLSLVFSGGVLALQLLASHDSDGMEAEAHAEHGHLDGGIAFWATMTSLRFWTFALLAAGVFGTLATLLGGPPLAVALIALMAGLGSGATATYVVRKLAAGRGSHSGMAEAVGKVARVLVALEVGRPGRVRVEIRGEMHDLVANASEPIGVGESVIVETMQGGVAVVSRAPVELRLGP